MIILTSDSEAIVVLRNPRVLLGLFFSLICLHPLNSFILRTFPDPVTFILLANDLLVLIFGINIQHLSLIIESTKTDFCY